MTPFQFYAKVDAKTILPSELQRYADYANFIQHRIIVGRMLWQVDEKTERYTTLKCAILRQYVPKLVLTKLMTALERTELIEDNGYWIEGKQSLGYRFKEHYAKMPTIRIPCRSERLANKIATKQRSDFGKFTKTHRHLWRWLNRLEIDMVGAQAEIDQLTPDENSKLSVDEYRELCRQAVNAIHDKQWEFGTCNYGRVHTVVTRLLAPMRRHLRIDGQALVSVDIANSQPLFLVATILAGLPPERVSSGGVFPERGREGGRFSAFFSGSGLPRSFSSPMFPTYTMSGLTSTGIQKAQNKGVTTPTTPLKPDGGVGADFGRFKELCETGRLYEELMAGIGWTTGKDKFKEDEVFRVLYGRNSGFDKKGNWNPSQLQPYLETHFPTVWGYMTGYKRAHGYKALSQEMQRQESRLMIDGVCGRLAVEYPECPIVTIHDSIHTFPQWVATVQRLIHEEFAKLGIRPTLRIEGDERSGVRNVAGNIWVQPVWREQKRTPIALPSWSGRKFREVSWEPLTWPVVVADSSN